MKTISNIRGEQRQQCKNDRLEKNDINHKNDRLWKKRLTNSRIFSPDKFIMLAPKIAWTLTSWSEIHSRTVKKVSHDV